jgi:hypothetical protein
MMTKKSRSEMSPEARQIIDRQYHQLQLNWVEEIDKPETDWERLFLLHFEMAVLEKRAKWLKPEVQA